MNTLRNSGDFKYCCGKFELNIVDTCALQTWNITNKKELQKNIQGTEHKLQNVKVELMTCTYLLENGPHPARWMDEQRELAFLV